MGMYDPYIAMSWELDVLPKPRKPPKRDGPSDWREPKSPIDPRNYERSKMKFSTIDNDGVTKKLLVREITKVSTAIRVVGLQYAQSIRLCAKMELGTVLDLKCEPLNEHDSKAVAVYLGSKRIGYIERNESGHVCDVLASLGSNQVTAVVSRVDTRADIYNMLWVVIEASFFVRA